MGTGAVDMPYLRALGSSIGRMPRGSKQRNPTVVGGWTREEDEGRLIKMGGREASWLLSLKTCLFLQRPDCSLHPFMNEPVLNTHMGLAFGVGEPERSGFARRSAATRIRKTAQPPSHPQHPLMPTLSHTRENQNTLGKTSTRTPP